MFDKRNPIRMEDKGTSRTHNPPLDKPSEATLPSLKVRTEQLHFDRLFHRHIQQQDQRTKHKGSPPPITTKDTVSLILLRSAFIATSVTLGARFVLGSCTLGFPCLAFAAQQLLNTWTFQLSAKTCT